MRLSKNFTLKEFTRSRTARLHGVPNRPDKEQVENIKSLVDNLLQPLRDRINCPITVTSGYRSKFLNRLVGGSYRSQHMEGKAADIYAGCLGLTELFRIIVEEFDYDQAIFEYGDWIHVSWNGENNRKQALVAVNLDGVRHYKVFNGDYDFLKKMEKQ